MQVNLRILHKDHIRPLLLCLLTCFQKRQHINASHSFPHRIHTPGHLLIFPADLRGNGKHLLQIPVHGITDRLFSPVLTEIGVDPSGKLIQIKLVELMLQKLCSLESIEACCFLLMNQPDTGETMIADFPHVKHAVAGPHPFDKVILLHQQKIFLKIFQITLCVNVIQLREQHRDITIMLGNPVSVPDLPFPVCRKLKCYFSVLKRGNLPAKIPAPRFVPPIRADNTVMVHPL